MHSFDDMHFALSSLVAVVVVLPQQRTPDFHMDEQFLGQQLLWSPIHTGLPVLQYHFCLPATNQSNPKGQSLLHNASS